MRKGAASMRGRGNGLVAGAVGVAAALMATSGGPAARAVGLAGAAPSRARVQTVCTVGVVRCASLVRTDLTVPGAQSSHGGYGPADLLSAYKLPAGGGAGRTVAVVDAYDDPNAEADLAVYRSFYGLAPCTTANGCFRKVNQSGQQGSYPRADAQWSQEISLDLDRSEEHTSEL